MNVLATILALPIDATAPPLSLVGLVSPSARLLKNVLFEIITVVHASTPPP